MQFLKNNNVKHICMYFGHLYDVLCETFSQIRCLFKVTHPLIAGLLGIFIHSRYRVSQMSELRCSYFSCFRSSCSISLLCFKEQKYLILILFKLRYTCILTVLCAINLVPTF